MLGQWKRFGDIVNSSDYVNAAIKAMDELFRKMATSANDESINEWAPTISSIARQFVHACMSFTFNLIL